MVAAGERVSYLPLHVQIDLIEFREDIGCREVCMGVELDMRPSILIRAASAAVGVPPAVLARGARR